jgi:Fe-S-cluster-containing dehydrogenase component
MQRRTFMKLMGASMALAGAACTRQPLETIVPYVRQPEDLVPGRPMYFATAMTLGGIATGVLVESHEGRPTKIEGNPDHPGSLGASDVFAQATILDLYDPDRARAITNLGEIRPWPAFTAAVGAALTVQEGLSGAGIRILTESISSPTLAAQLQEVLDRFPSAKWVQWDPTSRQSAREGARLAFGQYLDELRHIERADVILSLDSDFLASGPASLRDARAYASRRQPGAPDRMNRLYVVESSPSSTGSRADHRLVVRPSEVELVARRLAAACGVAGAADGAAPRAGLAAERTARWIDAVANDLQAHRGSSLVVAGDGQPPAVHALAHAMNAALGNAGRTVVYIDPVEASPSDQFQSVRELVADMDGGQVDLLLVVGGNPVYTVPADLPFAAALAKVPLSVHLGLHFNETSEVCHWQIPEVHFLESWSDGRAIDGSVSIVQPLILPLFGGRSPHELFAALAGDDEKTAYDIVREHWIREARSKTAPAAKPRASVDEGADDDLTATPEFEAQWRRWLHDGVVAGSAFAPVEVAVREGAVPPASATPGSGMELAFRNDPAVLDGRFSNNGWLQELPKPITRLTWDNAVLLSPATARALGVGFEPAMRAGEHGQVISDLVELRYQGRTVRGAVFPVAGHPDDCVTIHFGYGRRRAGRVGTGAGFDAYQLRTAEAPHFGTGLEMVRTGERRSLACVQSHHLMEGRGMIRAVTLADFARDPHVVHEGHHRPARSLTLNPDYPYEGYKWGMAIDVNACTGCNACVVGCQAENNIPVVGKDQVLRGREMHWLRIDTYHRGPEENPETFFQPVPCMQCENAPCEVVCPVNATVHSHEGLNDMVYNRCIGTRYCSNNCPYKVRRFNYHLYQDWETPSLKLGRNPDVTVRSRGVMEKCTYCVQRINAAKIETEQAGRRIADGGIKTACQAVCPTDAIIFGDLNDPKSRVAQLQAEARNYSLLVELNTRPRTTYLAAVRHVNPEIEAEA